MSRPVGPRSVRGLPPLVLAVCLAVSALAAAWSVVLPLGEGPDEPSHLGLVLHLADGGAYPDHDALRRTEGVVRLCTSYAASVRVCPAPGEAVTVDAIRVRGVDDAPPRSTRPAWDDDGGDRATDALNQMPQHPPLYYAVMAGVLRGARLVAGGTMSLDRELALLRLVNALLVLPVPALAWATARRAGAGDSAAVAAAILAGGLPVLVATGGVLNNDNLLVLLGAAVAPFLARLATGDRSRGTALAAGALVAAALLTKAFAVALVPALVVACLVGAGDRTTAVVTRLRRAVAPLAWAGAAVVVGAGWWYLRAWLRTGSPTPSADADRYTSASRPPGFSADPLQFLDGFAGRFTERFWGSFGWYSARLPGWLTVVLTGAAAILVLAGLRRARRGEPAPSRPVLAVLLVPAVLLAGLTLSRAWSLHVRSGQYPFIQGRYLLGGLVGLATVAALGWVRLVRGRRSITVLAAATSALQVGALLHGLGTYWAGGPVDRVRALAAWSGLPGGMAAAVLAAAASAVAAVVVLAARPPAVAPPPAGEHPAAPEPPVPSASP